MSLNHVYVAGTTVCSAADWNGIQAAWTAYTPTPTNFTIGDGTLTGRYLQLGKTILVRINFVAGSTSSYTASGMTVSLPWAAHATGQQGLPTRVSASGAIAYASMSDIAAAASVVALTVPTATGDCSLVGMSSASPNPGTTGFVVIEGAYEAA